MKDKTETENQTSGVPGDVQNIRTNGMASLAELREFIGSLKGRNPQEIMGEVASNGLVQGTVISAFGFLIILLVFTAIPYYMANDEPVSQKEKASTVASPENQTPGGANDDNQKKDDSKADVAKGKSGEAVLDKLGIGETKKAKPDENPLGEKFNDLLEGVK